MTVGRSTVGANDFDAQERRKHLMARTVYVETQTDRENTAFSSFESGKALAYMGKVQAFSELVRKFVRGRFFSICCVCSILLYGVSIGVQTELHSQEVKEMVHDDGHGEHHEHHDQEATMEWMSNFFVGIFIIEMCLRMVADGFGYFTGQDGGWNTLDLVINIIATLEIVLKVLVHVRLADISQNIMLMRVFRVIRIFRLVRFVRVVRAFRQLRILIFAILNTLKSAGWTLVLLCMIMYVFAIALTGAAVEILLENNGGDGDFADLSLNFGSLASSIFTLFQAVFGGIDWGAAIRPLWSYSLMHALLFYVYIVVTSMIVMNVVTGVFVQAAIESAQYDAEQVVEDQLADSERYCKRLKLLLKEIDPESSGIITLDQIESLLEEPVIKTYFTMLDLDPIDAWSLFRVLDTKEAGSLTVEEFTSGCLRLKGGARRIDISNMMYASKWTMNKLTKFAQETDTNLTQLTATLQELSDAQEESAEILRTTTTIANGRESRRSGFQEASGGLVMAPLSPREDTMCTRGKALPLRSSRREAKMLNSPREDPSFARGKALRPELCSFKAGTSPRIEEDSTAQSMMCGVDGTPCGLMQYLPMGSSSTPAAKTSPRTEPFEAASKETTGRGNDMDSVASSSNTGVSLNPVEEDVLRFSDNTQCI
eukprot:TRINITY_DN22217_c0_g1_i1.p1 TRINITY_DN22217_c0_g1~~TRINITY_DN22217_c0_g1_i1.p1  ORF type:complete len:759 (-),score=122.57 TRINITY_DN22217_c0_g1_i1:175-2136(-)